MKLNKKIIIIPILIILLILAIYFVFIYRVKTNESNKGLTIFEKLTMSDNEKEIYTLLSIINNNIINGNLVDSESDEIKKIDIKNEDINLKEFFNNIYEIKKYTNENNEINYIIDMDLKTEENQVTRRKFVIKDGKITTFSLLESDFDNLKNNNTNSTENSDFSNALSIYFAQQIIEAINKAIDEKWNKSISFNDVNYKKIIDKI